MQALACSSVSQSSPKGSQVLPAKECQMFTCAHTHAVGEQAVQDEGKDPLFLHRLSFLSLGRMPGRNTYKNRRQNKQLCQENMCIYFSHLRSRSNESREIMHVRHSSMIIFTSLSCFRVFPKWNLPSVFHSCLFQMDVRLRENTLQREELWLHGHRNLCPEEGADGSENEWRGGRIPGQ